MAAEPAEHIRTSPAATVPLSVPHAAADLAVLRRLSVRRHPLPWRYVVPRALALWLATRVLNVMLTVAFTSGTVIEKLWHWYFWDASWYLYIAQWGYDPSQDFGRAAFFPLYPLLAHLGVVAFGPFGPPSSRATLIALLIIANLGTLAALLALGLLAAHEVRSERAALLPMVLLAVSPLAIFLSGAYSDSIFLALVAAALLAGRRGHWRLAALAVALATLARPFGVLLLPALLVEYASQHQWWWHWRVALARRTVLWPAREVRCELLALVLVPALAVAGFLLVLWHQYGDPLAFIHVEDRYFGHAFRWPWQTLALVIQQLAAVSPHWAYPTAHMLLDALPLLGAVGVALTLTLTRHWPASFALYTLLSLVLCLTSPVVHAWGQYAVISDGRYCYGLVPVFLQLALWLRRWPRWAVVPLVGLCLIVQAVLTVFVLRGGWLV